MPGPDARSTDNRLDWLAAERAITSFAYEPNIKYVGDRQRRDRAAAVTLHNQFAIRPGHGAATAGATITLVYIDAC